MTSSAMYIVCKWLLSSHPLPLYFVYPRILYILISVYFFSQYSVVLFFVWPCPLSDFSPASRLTPTTYSFRAAYEGNTTLSKQSLRRAEHSKVVKLRLTGVWGGWWRVQVAQAIWWHTEDDRGRLGQLRINEVHVSGHYISAAPLVAL